MATNACGQDDFSLNASLDRKNKTLLLAIEGDNSAGCLVELFGSPTRRGGSKRTRLTSFVADSDPAYPISDVPRKVKTRRAVRRKSVFFSARLECEGIVSSTGVKRIRFAARRRGKSTVRVLENLAANILMQRTTIMRYLPALTFDSPVDLQAANDGSGRLFVVEQTGTIQLILPNRSVEEFIDISDRVLAGGERGLLGLVFDPDFSSNGFLYVNYTDLQGDTVIARFTAPVPSANTADPDSELIILTVEQPFSNHNAGQLQFGPDEMLYVALGDGGGAGDPDDNGQDMSTLLGSMLRIDVSSATTGNPYSIPADNPFVGNVSGAREEIFAFGLRNPFRFSFDPDTGLLWAGDVGQATLEEIDILEAGGNYGWNVVEGTKCFQSSPCRKRRFKAPVIVYGRDKGQSVSGGYVYRGTAEPALFGYYFYADFVSGRLWALAADFAKNLNIELQDTEFLISTFGITEEENLIFADYGSGRLYRVRDTGF